MVEGVTTPIADGANTITPGPKPEALITLLAALSLQHFTHNVAMTHGRVRHGSAFFVMCSF